MTIATTRDGNIGGCREGDLHVFRGVPYAEPPVGPLRWRDPQPIRKRRLSTWDATGFRARAWQPDSTLEALPPWSYLVEASAPPRDEDCLYLNIFTTDLGQKNMPVMIWLHGGAFAYGSGSHQVYHGGSLARKGVVVVTVNYRLGPLGFLNLNAVTDGRIPATGNEGLKDQLMAIEWVKRNIDCFGGAPDNITVFGESAGALSIGALLAMERSRGLFQRAILQSGSALTAAPLSVSVSVAERLMRHVGSSDPEALMEMDPEMLVRVTDQLGMEHGRMAYQPCIDGSELRLLPIEAIKEGSADGIDVLVGVNKDELRIVTHGIPTVPAVEPVGPAVRPVDVLSATYPDFDFGRVFAEYRLLLGTRGEPNDDLSVFAAIESDRAFRIPGILLSEALSRRGNATYQYLFDCASPALNGALGSCHVMDVGFVFGTYGDDEGLAKFFGADRKVQGLSSRMQEAWTSFARTGAPSCDAIGEWARYEEDLRCTAWLGATVEMVKAPMEERRRLLADAEQGTMLGRF